MESQARSHDPQARSETGSRQRGEDGEDCHLQGKPSTAGHDREQDIQEPDNRQNRRVECAVAVVSNHMGKEAYDRRGKTADY